MKRLRNSFGLLLFVVLFVSFVMPVSAQDYQLKAKKDSKTGKWGYENVGEKYYWWAAAHQFGKKNKEMNQDMAVQWVIAPMYDKVADEFSEGLAAVELNGKVGYIDKRNRYIIPPIYDSMGHLDGFHYGLGVVKTGGKYGFINKKGEFVYPPVYDGADSFGDDYLATVKLGKKFGAIDLTGDTVVPVEFIAKEVMKLMPGKNKKYREAKRVAKERWDKDRYLGSYDKIRLVSERMDTLIADSLYLPVLPKDRIVFRNDSTSGILTADGDTLLNGEFSEIQELEHGFFRVKNKGTIGIVDCYGRMVMQPWYHEIRYQPDQRIFIFTRRFANTENAEVGLANRAGGCIIPGVFTKIEDFEGPYAKAWIRECSSWLDVNGLMEENFYYTLAETSYNDKSGFYAKRLVGVLPTSTHGHNRLGIYYASECDDLKNAIKQFSIAHRLDPDDPDIEANLKMAKSERNNRRWNRVLKGLQIAGAVLTLSATAVASYESAKNGNSFSSGDFASASMGDVSGENVSSYGSGNKSHSGGGTGKTTDVAANHANYSALDRSYSRYESMVIDCINNPEKHKASDKREYQKKMREIRKKIEAMGRSRSKSPYEDK